MKSPTAASGQLHKSPIFTILVALMALLVVLSLFMYSQLETIARDDDVLPGSSGGDGQGFDLRSRFHRHHTTKKHNKHAHAQQLPGGGPMMAKIADFVQYKEWEAQRRAKQGKLSSREQFEHDTPYGTQEELMQKVQQLRRDDLKTFTDGMPYDIYNCPHDPPPNYPYAWNVRNVLENWNPDNTDLPSRIHQGLCVFDWTTEQNKALNYRDHQVPFVLQNNPEVVKASVRWTSDQYLHTLLGDEKIRNEHSLNNHFMYWKTRHPAQHFDPPTDMTELTFGDWYQHALALEHESAISQVSKEHWYFRLNALLDKHGYVYEELPFFDPSLGQSMTMIHPQDHRGINCRFGMKGVTAETHFDSSSNFIALMGGQRRYILAHPNQCIQMELYPQDHPSGRHASINWATFDKWDTPRPFTKAQVNEVVLQAGDLMYLPTYWFHFIVSLNLNYQCNSRSGDSPDYEDFIADCGFQPATRKHR